MQKSLSYVLVFAVTAGCYAAAADGNGANGASAPATVDLASTGLPCDVAELLNKECWQCHGTKPQSDAKVSLVTYENLAALDKGSGKKLAEVAVDRVHNAKDPMPPSSSGKTLPAETLAPLEKWVAAGMPQGTCSDSSATSSEFDVESVCTSNSYWPKTSNHESPLMHPGRACISCHEEEDEGPTLTAAGTVYPTAHEPDDCNAKGLTNLRVIITDATGKELTAKVNTVGNFMFENQSFKKPYRARVVDSKTGATREMKDEQTEGDCNTCHTQDGTKDAPGRILSP